MVSLFINSEKSLKIRQMLIKNLRQILKWPHEAQTINKILVFQILPNLAFDI